MRKVGKVYLSEKEFKAVKNNFIRFYETNKKCSEICPMGFHIDPVKKPSYLRRLEEKIRRTSDKENYTGYDADGMCVCFLFEEFYKEGQIGQACPCDVFGKYAFTRLKKLVSRLSDGRSFPRVTVRSE